MCVMLVQTESLYYISGGIVPLALYYSILPDSLPTLPMHCILFLISEQANQNLVSLTQVGKREVEGSENSAIFGQSPSQDTQFALARALLWSRPT